MQTDVIYGRRRAGPAINANHAIPSRWTRHGYPMSRTKLGWVDILPELRRSVDVLAITPAFFLYLPRSFLFQRPPSPTPAWSSPLASGETAPQPVVNHPRVAHTFRELTRPPLQQTGQSSSRVYSRRIPADGFGGRGGYCFVLSSSADDDFGSVSGELLYVSPTSFLRWWALWLERSFRLWLVVGSLVGR